MYCRLGLTTLKQWTKTQILTINQCKILTEKKRFLAPKRVKLVTKYILDHFNQKTYRNEKNYIFNAVTNIGEVVKK